MLILRHPHTGLILAQERSKVKVGGGRKWVGPTVNCGTVVWLSVGKGIRPVKILCQPHMTFFIRRLTSDAWNRLPCSVRNSPTVERNTGIREQTYIEAKSPRATGMPPFVVAMERVAMVSEDFTSMTMNDDDGGDNNNNNNTHDNVYSAVIMTTRSLREFTRFI